MYPMRVLLCARHSRSRAAQLVAFDSGDCAESADSTAPLVFLPASALDPARHGLASRTRAAPGVYAHAARACLVNRWQARVHSRTFRGRDRRAGFGHDGNERHEAICPPCADFAEDGLAASQLNFTTGDARRILGCHLSAAYDADRGQRHENRRAAPAANKRRVRNNARKPIDLRRSRCSVNRWGRARKRWPHELCTANRQRAEAIVR
jgi:hypothetical protein